MAYTVHFPLMPEAYSDWPPHVPRLEEYNVSKRMALVELCDIEPKSLQLVDSGDLFELSDHFAICFQLSNDEFRPKLSLHFVGTTQEPPKRHEVGIMREMTKRQVDVHSELSKGVLARLAEKDEKLDLRTIADYLIGETDRKIQALLEEQSRWPDIPTAQESLQKAYEEIMAGRLPQNSE